MDYKIFLDDIRMPTDIYPKTDNNSWIIARNLTEFKEFINKNGAPSYVSFDNDLGENLEEGKDAVKWIVFEKELDIRNTDYKVHSANSSGVREYMIGTLDNWKKHLSNEKKIRQEVRQILKKSLLKEEEVRIKFNIPIPEDILKIKNLLKQKGYKLFVVGGAVRDALLGKEPKDYDLATDALPDIVQGVVSPFYKTLETGKVFGIINVLTPSGEYEIATFRKDIGAGRRPDSVEFTTIDQDVLRRDLTINALFYDIDKQEIVDLVGGVSDLKKGIVKTVGSAEDRFNEDRLRIMRAVRFAARFGSDLDPSVDAALQKDSRLGGFPELQMGDTVSATSNVSAERIRDEFIKGIKSAKSVVHFLNLIQKYKLFDWVFKGLNYKEDFIEERIIPVLLAYLLIDNDSEKLKKQLNQLKYSVDEITQISFLKHFYSLNSENVIKLKKAQQNSKLSNSEILTFSQWMQMNPKFVNTFLNFKLSINSKELIDKGFTGKALGDEIERRETENFLIKLKGI